MTDYTLHLDFGEVLEVALRGVRRASVFMGLGINAALNPDLTEYKLSKFSQIQTAPELTPEQIEVSKGDFRLWIESCGFRELTESFSRFLDGIHWICSMCEQAGIAAKAISLLAMKHKFEARGLKDRLEVLKKYGVESKNEAHLLALNKARNCYAHRLGQVDRQDVDASGILPVSWLGMDILAKEPNGKETVLDVDLPREVAF